MGISGRATSIQNRGLGTHPPCPQALHEASGVPAAGAGGMQSRGEDLGAACGTGLAAPALGGDRPTDRTVEPEVRYRGEGGTAGEHGALVCVPRWEDGRAQVPTVILGARQRGGGLSAARGHGGPAGSHFHAVSFRLFFECPLKSCLREGKVTSEFFPARAPCDAGPAPLGPSGEQPEEGVTWWTPCECGVTGVTVASPVSCLWAKPTHFL